MKTFKLTVNDNGSIDLEGEDGQVQNLQSAEEIAGAIGAKSEEGDEMGENEDESPETNMDNQEEMPMRPGKMMKPGDMMGKRNGMEELGDYFSGKGRPRSKM